MFQFPPTPTPFPPGTAHFELPSEYSLWGATDMAIQFWNWTGTGGTIFQLLALIAMVIGGMFVVWRFVQQFTRKDAED